LNTQALLSSALAETTVLECGDERGEFAGMLLASLGADVIKLEGRNGSNSRRLGPFTTPDRSPEHSFDLNGKRLHAIGVSNPFLYLSDVAMKNISSLLVRRTRRQIDPASQFDV